MLVFLDETTRLEGGAKLSRVMNDLKFLLFICMIYRCLGIQCNIWGRAQDSTHLVYQFRGGGAHLTGYRALMRESLLTKGLCRRPG